MNKTLARIVYADGTSIETMVEQRPLSNRPEDIADRTRIHAELAHTMLSRFSNGTEVR